ncbi:MAG: flagellar basal body-associated FliL family protein [Pseudomonadota bacterium]
MSKLLPVLLLLIGTGAGFGAGIFLAPDPVECPDPSDLEGGAALPEGCEPEPDLAEGDEDASAEEAEAPPVEFVRMNDQIVVPVLSDGDVRSLVVLSITLEVDIGQTAAIFALEPKLRDAFLRVLFDHANVGGFDGNYTDAARMEGLRRALLEIARKTGGDVVQNVLILDLLRQDV